VQRNLGRLVGAPIRLFLWGAIVESYGSWSNPMRVLLCLNNKDFGGPLINIFQLARSLRARGHVLGIVLSSLDEQTRSVVNEHVGVYERLFVLPLVRPSRGGLREQLMFVRAFPGNLRDVSAAIAAWKPDVVHTMTIGDLAPLLAARLLGVPTVAHVREMFPRPRVPIYLLNHLVALCACRVAAVSPRVESFLLRSDVPRRKLIVLENGIDYATFSEAPAAPLREQLDLGLDALIVGMVGQLSAWKGHEEAIRALATLIDLNVHLVCVGEETRLSRRLSYRARLQTLADEIGVPERLHFVGFQHARERYLKAFDVFLQPSVEPDPFPTTVLEALAAGVPTIGSPLGGIPYQLGFGEHGIVLSAPRASQIADAIREIHRDPSAAAVRVAAGDEYARTQTWDLVADRTERVYFEVQRLGCA